MSRPTEYWVLVEPSNGETIERPGGLFKYEDGIPYRLDGPDTWTEAPHLIAYRMLGESGAEPIDDARAEELIAEFPWPGSRAAAKS